MTPVHNSQCYLINPKFFIFGQKCEFYVHRCQHSKTNLLCKILKELQSIQHKIKILHMNTGLESKNKKKKSVDHTINSVKWSKIDIVSMPLTTDICYGIIALSCCLQWLSCCECKNYFKVVGAMFLTFKVVVFYSIDTYIELLLIKFQCINLYLVHFINYHLLCDKQLIKLLK